MSFCFNRVFSRNTTLSPVCQTVSGSKAEHCVPRGTCQASQRGCDGSEATAQDKVLTLFTGCSL